MNGFEYSVKFIEMEFVCRKQNAPVVTKAGEISVDFVHINCNERAQQKNGHGTAYNFSVCVVNSVFEQPVCVLVTVTSGVGRRITIIMYMLRTYVHSFRPSFGADFVRRSFARLRAATVRYCAAIRRRRRPLIVKTKLPLSYRTIGDEKRGIDRTLRNVRRTEREIS